MRGAGKDGIDCFIERVAPVIKRWANRALLEWNDLGRKAYRLAKRRPALVQFIEVFVKGTALLSAAVLFVAVFEVQTSLEAYEKLLKHFEQRREITKLSTEESTLKIFISGTSKGNGSASQLAVLLLDDVEQFRRQAEKESKEDFSEGQSAYLTTMLWVSAAMLVLSAGTDIGLTGLRGAADEYREQRDSLKRKRIRRLMLARKSKNPSRDTHPN